MSGAVPPPAARSLGRAAGLPRPVCPGSGGCGCGGQAPTPQRALLRTVDARCGGGRRASPGGVALRRREGRLGSGALPPSTASPLGGLSGSAVHVLWARVCVCAVCVVPVRCLCAGGCVAVQRVPWCVVLPVFVCLPGASLSGDLLWCCARRVLGVPPSPRSSLARWLSYFFVRCCALVTLSSSLSLPALLPGISPCLRPGVCLGLPPCLLTWSWFPGPLLSLLLRPVRQREDEVVGLWAAARYGTGATIRGVFLCRRVGVGTARHTSVVTFVR